MMQHRYWIAALCIAPIVFHFGNKSPEREQRNEALSKGFEPGISVSKPAVKRASQTSKVGMQMPTPEEMPSVMPPEAKAYDLSNPNDQAELAARLRLEGMPEDDILRMLKTNPDEPTDPATEVTGKTYDLSNDGDRAAMLAELKSEGMTEGEIQRFRMLSEGGTDAPPDDTSNAESKSYDLNDPAQRQQVVSELRSAGVGEAELQRISEFEGEVGGMH